LAWEDYVEQLESAIVTDQDELPAFCGKPVSQREWKILREILDSCGLSRHELASTICEGLGWVRPNGGLKTRECYEYLNLLEARGLIELPAQREQRRRGPTSISYTEAGAERRQLEGTLSDVAPMRLGLVTTAQERALWRELVARYHYLGHKVPYGASLRYLVWMSTPRAELAGCVQFSSAARRLASRDGYIGWDEETRQRNLQQVVNNSRFLILPWLSIKGLASHVLSVSARIMVEDWEEAYRVKPVLLETFVDRERYEGTCYRAANWIEVGETTGRGRMDREGTAAGPVKTCLVYPLTDDFRLRLCGEGRG
jgi:hypothetical protein